ncbi:MAG: coiled-coil domain-containing protein [Mycobacterium sp.]
MRAARAVCPLTLTVAMTLTVPGLAEAEPDQESSSVAALVADVAQANQKLQEVGARVQAEQESVNKAIVEVQEARDVAGLAQQQVEASQLAVKETSAAIVDAQKKFDTFAAATYVNGPSASLVMARTPDEIISTATAGKTLALTAQQVMNGLGKARAAALDSDAVAQSAKLKADEAVQAAQSSQDAAVAALTNAQNTFRQQQAEIDRLAAERAVAQQKLEAARQWAAPVADAALTAGAAGERCSARWSARPRRRPGCSAQLGRLRRP